MTLTWAPPSDLVYEGSFSFPITIVCEFHGFCKLIPCMYMQIVFCECSYMFEWMGETDGNREFNIGNDSAEAISPL